MSAARATVVGAAVAAMLGSLAVWIVSAVSVLMEDELGLTEFRLGVAVSVYFATSALVAWLGGGLSDRLGARRTLTAGAVCSVAAVAAIGLLARSWVHVVALLALAGIGSAVIQPATNHAIARGVSLRRHGLALGVKQASVPAATTIAGVAVPTLAETFGWRWAFAVPVVVGVGFLLVRSRLPNARQPSARLTDASDGEQGVRLPLVLLAVAGGIGISAISAATAFLVRYLVVREAAVGTAGWVLALASAAGVTMRIASGWRADRPGSDVVRTIVVLLSVGSLGAAGLALAPASTPLLAASAVLMVGAGWGWNALLVLAIVRAYPATPGLATGISQVGIRAGGAVGPSAFGLVVAAAGYRAGWLVVAGALVSAAAVIFAGGRLLPAPSPESASAGTGEGGPGTGG